MFYTYKSRTKQAWYYDEVWGIDTCTPKQQYSQYKWTKRTKDSYNLGVSVAVIFPTEFT